MTADTSLATTEASVGSRRYGTASRGDASRPRRTLRQLGSFAVIGVVSTLAYVALYAFLRVVSPAAVANAVALVVTAVGNTAANRRLTFDIRGPGGLARDHAAGLLALGAALAITSVSLATLGLVSPHASRAMEITVLVAANAAATLVRFLLLRLVLDRVRSGGLRAVTLGSVTAEAALERTTR